MGTSVLNRRQWLQQTGGVIAAVSTLWGAEARLEVRAFEPDGRPVGADRLKTLLLTDSDGQPYHLLPEARADGTASIELPNGKFEMMMILPVRDFGQVYLYADNGGALYPPSTAGELLLNYEFARSRAAFVRRYVKAAQAEGVVFSSGVTERLKRGEAALAKASDAGEPAARAGHSNDSLADTMWAGEMAAVERARHHIARDGPRPASCSAATASGTRARMSMPAFTASCSITAPYRSIALLPRRSKATLTIAGWRRSLEKWPEPGFSPRDIRWSGFTKPAFLSS